MFTDEAKSPRGTSWSLVACVAHHSFICAVSCLGFMNSYISSFTTSLETNTGIHMVHTQTNIVICGYTDKARSLGICVSSGVECLHWKLHLMPLQTTPPTKQLSSVFSGSVVIFAHSVTSSSCCLKRVFYWRPTNRSSVFVFVLWDVMRWCDLRNAIKAVLWR